MNEKRKICMLGATGVGKSSLVHRYVHSIFSETYQTTVGVRIEKRSVWHSGRAVDLVIWDLSGEDEFQSVQLAYLRGTSGYLLVADGTRRETLETAVALQRAAVSVVGRVPAIVVLNKVDLAAQWDLTDADESSLATRGSPVVKTSARTGDGVVGAFGMLVDAILGVERHP